MPVLYPGAVWLPAPGPFNDVTGEGHWESFTLPREFVVAHHSAASLYATIATFTSPTGVNSAHLAIDRDDPVNTVYQFVSLDCTAFHAGDLAANQASWGVETIRTWGDGPGSVGYQPITDGQYRRWHEVATYLADLGGWPADADHVVPHRYFVPDTCPGDLDIARIIKGDGFTIMDPDTNAALRKGFLVAAAAGAGASTKDADIDPAYTVIAPDFSNLGDVTASYLASHGGNSGGSQPAPAVLPPGTYEVK